MIDSLPEQSRNVEPSPDRDRKGFGPTQQELTKLQRQFRDYPRYSPLVEPCLPPKPSIDKVCGMALEWETRAQKGLARYLMEGIIKSAEQLWPSDSQGQLNKTDLPK